MRLDKIFMHNALKILKDALIIEWSKNQKDTIFIQYSRKYCYINAKEHNKLKNIVKKSKKRLNYYNVLCDEVKIIS